MLEPTGIITFRQADIGEYLREVCNCHLGNYYDHRLNMLHRRRIRFSQHD